MLYFLHNTIILILVIYLRCIFSEVFVCILLYFKAREEFHAHLAATRNQQQMPNDLMDDSELLTDDRELDSDLNGNHLICNTFFFQSVGAIHNK